MGSYIARRLLWTAFVVVGITLFTFTISHVIPADPARLAAGLEAPQEQVERIRRELGLDRPLVAQYLRYLRGLVRGDLGQSIRNRRSVAQDILIYLPATIELTIAAMLVTVGLGVPLGVAAALRRGGFTDFALRLAAVAGAAMPSFWLALVLQLLFFRELGWLPSGARLDPLLAPPPTVTGFYTVDSAIAAEWPSLWNSMAHLILPTVALAAARLAVVVRVARRSFLQVLGTDYVRTAWAKGLSAHRVIWRHTAKNALIPIVTVVSLQVGWLLGGTVLVEVIFSWPGLGRYALEAIGFLDFPAIMGVTLVVSLMFVFINLAVDILYTLIDPRIQY